MILKLIFVKFRKNRLKNIKNSMNIWIYAKILMIFLMKKLWTNFVLLLKFLNSI